MEDTPLAPLAPVATTGSPPYPHQLPRATQRLPRWGATHRQPPHHLHLQVVLVT